MRLSIIVPMYNVAPYVERCLRSLAEQDLPLEDYEIICVNDGSPDNCREIVEGLQQEFGNLILINQENQGVSMARNNALAIAQGRYMMPVDPDDYLAPNCLKRLLDKAERQQLDVLYGAFEIFDFYGRPVWRTDYRDKAEAVVVGVEGYFAVRGPQIRDPDRSVAILYRMDLLRQYDIQYPRDVPFLEDGLFLGKVFAVAQRVGFDDGACYLRTSRPGSATNSKLFTSEKAIYGFFEGLDDLEHFKAGCINLTSDAQLLLDHVRAKFILLPLGALILKNNFALYRRAVVALGEKGYRRISSNGLRFLYKDLVKVYNFNKFLFYYLYPVILRLHKICFIIGLVMFSNFLVILN